MQTRTSSRAPSAATVSLLLLLAASVLACTAAQDATTLK